MQKSAALRAALLAGAMCSPVNSGRAEPPVLSEVQWQNASTLRDEEGDTSDWIEIRNPGPNPVDLGNYRLVENLANVWPLPGGVLEGFGHRLVFASGKNRGAPHGPWHASFSIQAGDQLRLETLDGVATGPAWIIPDGPGEVAWGMGSPPDGIPLIDPAASLRYEIEATGNSLTDPVWADRDFDDSAWRSGVNGLLMQRSAPGFVVQTWGLKDAPVNGRQLRVALAKPRHAWLVAETSAGTMDFTDGAASALNFSENEPHPAPSGSPVTVHAAFASVRVPTAGVYTVAIHSTATNDVPLQYVIQIDDQLIESGMWAPGPIDVVPPVGIDVPAPGGLGEVLHEVTLSRPGFVPVRVIWLMPPAGDRGFEVSLAGGSRQEFGVDFHALGSTAHPARVERAIPSSWNVGTDITAGFPLDGAGVVSRFRFDAPPATHPFLRLHVQGADGFRAWIDGQLVASRNAAFPATLAERVLPPAGREQVEEVDLAISGGQLTGPPDDHILVVETLRATGQSGQLAQHVGLIALPPGNATAPSFLAYPTPGRPNAQGVLPPVADPTPSHARGVYDGPLTVSLSHPAPGVELFFTTDGTPPQAIAEHIYTGPFEIAATTVLQAFAVLPGSLPSHTILHTYLIPGAQSRQAGAGLPPSWGVNPARYEFEPALAAELGTTLPAMLRSLPSISLVLPSDELFGELGMYPNGDLRGDLSACDASAEFIYPRGGVAWRERASMRVKGEASRFEGFAKRGFRLDFGSGRGDLRRPVLETTGRTRYNTLMLNGSFVDNILTLGGKAQYIRDLWVRDTLNRMGHPAAHGDYAHLYLNGLYWGLYHSGERSDAQWCAHYLGGTAADWDVIDSDGVISGTDAGWSNVVARTHLESPTQADYDFIASHLDLDGFCDYMIVNLYAVNTDWPGHNWYAARDRRTDVWRFITWDAEYSFDRPTQNMIPDVETSLGGVPGDLLRFLSRFPDFIDRFSNRVRLHCTGEGALTPAIAEATWIRRAAQIDRAIAAEYARWSGAAVDFEGNPILLRKQDWEAELNRLRTTWFPGRTRTLTRQLRGIGLYSEVHPPRILPEQSHLDGPRQVSVINTGSNADLYFTTDGSDPRGPDGRPSSTAIRYSAPFEITAPAVVKARGWYDGESSPLVTATYVSGVDPRGLKLSEISFRPDNSLEEFVEIINRGPAPIPLDGVQLADAVRFSFPAGITVPPGGVVVVVRDTAAFQVRFPGVPVAGQYQGALADEGERLLLTHPQAGVLDEVSFRPYEPWPSGPGSLHRAHFGRAEAMSWERSAAGPGLFSEMPFGLAFGAPSKGILPVVFPVRNTHHYEIQWTDDLSNPWRPLRAWSPIFGADSLEHPIPFDQNQRFIRVIRTPLP